MTPEQSAMLMPSKALFELWHALVFHLFERKEIDPIALADVIDKRRLQIEAEDAIRAEMLRAQIDWLKNLRSGVFVPPSTFH